MTDRCCRNYLVRERNDSLLFSCVIEWFYRDCVCVFVIRLTFINFIFILFENVQVQKVFSVCLFVHVD